MQKTGRYNKLKNRKQGINELICYRTETSVAEILASYMAKDKDEKRMLFKQIAKSQADIVPDYEHISLTITHHYL